MENKQEARSETALMELYNLYQLMTEDEQRYQEEVGKVRKDLAVMGYFLDDEVKLMARLANVWPHALPMKNLADGIESDCPDSDELAAASLTHKGVTRFVHSATGESYLVVTERTVMDLLMEIPYLLLHPEEPTCETSHYEDSYYGESCCEDSYYGDYNCWAEEDRFPEHDQNNWYNEPKEEFYPDGEQSYNGDCGPEAPAHFPQETAPVTTVGGGHFFEKLRDVRNKELLDTAWIQGFRKELNNFSDSDFAKGWRKLGADKLNEEETRAFCFALREFIHNFTKPIAGMEIKRDGTEGPQAYNEIVPQENMENLVRNGLLISFMSGYLIAPKVAEVLLHGHDEIVSYADISKTTTVIKSADVKKKRLFFSDESEEDMKRLYGLLSSSGFKSACKTLKKQKRNPSVQMLFWGGPGTGKTETVKQVARKTKRDIFLLDVAKITNCLLGETEKMYRRLFTSYRFIVAVKNDAPILLLNEADQVLSKRMDLLERSIDKYENSITDLLLEEMENMHGILLATTNHKDLLDPAFDRRFLFKVELKKPDAGARKSIWKSMMRGLSDQDAEHLAVKYEISGAQISNIVAKRDLDKVCKMCGNGLPYLEGLCEKELGTGKPAGERKRVGYSLRP